MFGINALHELCAGLQPILQDAAGVVSLTTRLIGKLPCQDGGVISVQGNGVHQSRFVDPCSSFSMLGCSATVPVGNACDSVYAGNNCDQEVMVYVLTMYVGVELVWVFLYRTLSAFAAPPGINAHC